MRAVRLFATLFLTALLYLLGQSTSYADDVVPPAPEQVVVSPAQAAVNTALATATTEVAQAAQALARSCRDPCHLPSIRRRPTTRETPANRDPLADSVEAFP